MAQSSSAVTDPDELKIIVNALSDTLIEYIMPRPVIDASPFFKSHATEFMPTDVANQDNEITQNFVHWIIEDESEEAELIFELRKALHTLCDDSRKGVINCKGGNRLDIHEDSKLNTILQMLDGSLLKQLTKEEASSISRFLCEKKFLSEKSCQLALKKTGGYEICLELLKNLRQRKPEWPFEFLKCLKDIQTSQESNQSERGALPLKPPDTTVEPPLLYTEGSGAPPVDLVHQADGILKMPPKMSSKFSDLETESANNNINDELKKQEAKHMTDFSDESSDEYDSDDPDTDETPDLPLREYQKELAVDALNGLNTIICAPTGSGKTRVATHIIRCHLEKAKADGKPKPKVAFLARTVPLVMQQFKSLKKYLPPKYKMENVTGDSEYSMSLHKFLDSFDVLVMTPRILENHVKGETPLIPTGLAAFSLLVFDECHHTRKGEAYNTLMLSYLHAKRNSTAQMPQIIGLTASIGVEKAKDVTEAEGSILEICSNLDAESISTVKDNLSELKELVPVPKEEIHNLRERDQSEPVEKILEIIANLERSARHHITEVKNEELQNLLKRIPVDKKSQPYGQWVVKMEKAAMSIQRHKEVETNTSVRSLIIIADHLKAYNVALEIYDLVELRDVVGYLEKCFSRYMDYSDSLTRAEQTFYNFFTELKAIREVKGKRANPNLKALRKVIKENLLLGEESQEARAGNENVSKGIVFVRTRFLAHALASFFEHCKDGQLRALGASVFTGTEASEVEGGMTSTQQEEIVQRFKSGDIRLLVATSVGEEGLDIPECNLVIKYNHVGNEVTTVQMRGRSRKKGGKSVLLAFDNLCKKERINQYNANMMQEAVQNVSRMKASDIREKNRINQEKILKSDEIDKLVKLQGKSHLIEKPFKMVCKLCRQVVIESGDIKVIDDSHHVVVNRDFMQQVEKKRNPSLQVNGQMVTYGSALCKGKPEKKASCRNTLGFLMIFSKIPFVVLSVKSFGFEAEDISHLNFYNSWKKVPYCIQDIQMEDIQRGLPDQKTLLNEQTDKNSGDDGFSGDKKQMSKSGLGTKSAMQNKDPVGKSADETKTATTDQPDASVTEAKHMATGHSDESATHAKAIAMIPPRPRLSGRDSGFLSEAPSGQDNESTTDPKVVAARQSSLAAAEAGYQSDVESHSTTDAKAVVFPSERQTTTFQDRGSARRRNLNSSNTAAAPVEGDSPVANPVVRQECQPQQEQQLKGQHPHHQNNQPQQHLSDNTGPSLEMGFETLSEISAFQPPASARVDIEIPEDSYASLQISSSSSGEDEE